MWSNILRLAFAMVCITCCFARCKDGKPPGRWNLLICEHLVFEIKKTVTQLLYWLKVFEYGHESEQALNICSAQKLIAHRFVYYKQRSWLHQTTHMSYKIQWKHSRMLDKSTAHNFWEFFVFSAKFCKSYIDVLKGISCAVLSENLEYL